jgi:hypothetical protein
MDNVVELTSLYIVILLLALLVERFMEILSSVWNYIEWKANLHEFWNRRAEKLKKKFEARAKSQILLRALSLAGLTRQLRNVTRSHKKGHSGIIIIISGALVRQVSVATVSRFVASILGVAFCYLAKVNLVDIFNRTLEFDLLRDWPNALKLILSGVVIGLGSEPVHSLIMAVERQREKRTRKAELEKVMAETTR